MLFVFILSLSTQQSLREDQGALYSIQIMHGFFLLSHHSNIGVGQAHILILLC